MAPRLVDVKAVVDFIATNLPENCSPLWVMPLSEALDRNFEGRELPYARLAGVSGSKRQSAVDPPIAQQIKLDREAKEKADLLAYRNEQAKRDREREQRLAPKPTFPHCKRLIDELGPSGFRKHVYVDLEPQLNLATANQHFIVIGELPELYIGYGEAFAKAESSARARINAIRARGGDYKWGATIAPSIRFLTRERHGYFELGYRRLYVVFAGPSSWVAELEMRGISVYRDTPGCQNKSPGGEHIPNDGYLRYVYIAEAPKGLGYEDRSHVVMNHRLSCLGRCEFVAKAENKLEASREVMRVHAIRYPTSAADVAARDTGVYMCEQPQKENRGPSRNGCDQPAAKRVKLEPIEPDEDLTQLLS